MGPDELEFIDEKARIGIIPNFNFDAIHLISGSVGPFRAGLQMHIPIWLAIHLKKQQKCRIVIPTWLNRDTLEDKKEEEKRIADFSVLPCEEFMVVCKLIFGCAAEEIAGIEDVKTLVKDIFDLRQAKLRSAIESIFVGKSQLDEPAPTSLTNLTHFEIHSVKPFFPHAADLVARLERVWQQHTSNTNESSGSHSASFLSSSRY